MDIHVFCMAKTVLLKLKNHLERSELMQSCTAAEKQTHVLIPKNARFNSPMWVKNNIKQYNKS